MTVLPRLSTVLLWPSLARGSTITKTVLHVVRPFESPYYVYAMHRPTIFSKSESRRNFKFGKDIGAHCTQVTGTEKLRSKGQR